MRELVRRNLLITIENSIESKIFSVSLWEDGPRVRDIIDKGRFGCALYTSSILLLFRHNGKRLCQDRRATVTSFLSDILSQDSGWYGVDTSHMTPGCILVWEERRGNEHVGFYVGDGKAVSTCRIKGVPIKHNWLSETDNRAQRAVKQIFKHTVLAI